ncbi:hypothetical protein [Streptomyces scopuliridis]|uniref:hypothetical protein n=1 Tax=Streptomyces scopuliridis TaxID=452529 RepID=UPI003676DA3A
MSATTHDQATTHQAGQNQYITTNNYHGVAASEPSTNGAPDGSAGADGGSGGWFAAHRSPWISALATIVAALGLTAVLWTPEDDNSSDEKDKASQSASSNPAAEKTNATPGDPGSASPTPTMHPAGTVQWEGTVLLSNGGSGDKDSDAPRPASADWEHSDFYVLSLSEITINTQPDGATVALWEDRGQAAGLLRLLQHGEGRGRR